MTPNGWDHVERGLELTAEAAARRRQAEEAEQGAQRPLSLQVAQRAKRA